MKKIYLLILPLLFIANPAFADYNGVSTFSSTDIPSDSGKSYINSNYVWNNVTKDEQAPQSLGDGNGITISASNYADGLWLFMKSYNCAGSGYSYCLNNVNSGSPTSISIYSHNGLWYTTLPAPPPAYTGVGALIHTASSSMDQAFGFGFDAGIAFMKNQLWSIVASFLFVLQSIIGFVIAIIVISTIVGLIYLGFRHFKH